MNSRFYRLLIVSALLITASGAWAQQSAPPASDQTLKTDSEFRRIEFADHAPPAPDQKRVAVIKQQAANGDATAQYVLAAMYSSGTGVPQDRAQAGTWFRKAAEQGDASAQERLGSLYEYGKGVSQDYAQAAAWFRKAAEQGDADAQWMLGALYDEG
jgi:TPR repeat protein